MSGATNVYERTEEARWFFSYCKKQNKTWYMDSMRNVTMSVHIHVSIKLV